MSNSSVTFEDQAILSTLVCRALLNAQNGGFISVARVQLGLAVKRNEHAADDIATRNAVANGAVASARMTIDMAHDFGDPSDSDWVY